MIGKELIDVTLASSDETKKVCPYFRVGYCKYKKHCKHFHPSENCSERKCRDKNCNKRHRKLCRFGRICIRIESCEFLHEEGNRSTTDTSEKDNKLQILEELINTKDTLILELAEKVELLEASVKSMKEDIEEFRKSKSKSINIIEKVDPIQLDPNKPCERCDKIFTTDRDLRYHKKHEHQEDKSVVKKNYKDKTVGKKHTNFEDKAVMKKHRHVEDKNVGKSMMDSWPEEFLRKKSTSAWEDMLMDSY